MKYFSVATAFVFYYDAKNSDPLRGSSHVRCYLFLEKSIVIVNNLQQIFIFLIGWMSG